MSHIFIIGPHRAGSTLWHNLIVMCAGIMRLTDPRFLSDWRHKDFRHFLNTAVGDLSRDEEVDKMVDLCFARRNLPGLDSTFWRFQNIQAADDPQLKLRISRGIKGSDRSLAAIARIFIDEITRFSGYERACVKFPVDIGHVSELLRWFPDCRVIHITRDPRAVAMSKTNDPSGTALSLGRHPRLAPFIKKINIWPVISQYRRAAKVHRHWQSNANYKLFRYEDLLARPRETLEQLCEFINVEFNSILLHPEAGLHLHQPSSLTGKQTKSFDPAAAIRWQSVIPAFDEYLITRLTAKSMKILGYNPATHPIFSCNERSKPALQEAV